MSLQLRAVATLRVAGRNLGTFDVYEGGETSADEQKHRFGGDIEETSLGGPRTTSNLTLRRVWRNALDQPNRGFLRGQVGTPENAEVGISDLDDQQRAFGTPEVYTGSLIRYKPPEGDSSSNDKRWLEIEVSCNGLVKS